MAKKKAEHRPAARKPLFQKRFGAVTISVQRSSRPLYDAKTVMRENGKVLRERYLKTKGEALALAQTWTVEVTNTGAQAAATVTDDEKMFFLKARKLLEPYGRSLEDALSHYLGHLKANESSVSLHEAIESLLLRKEKSRPRYFNDLRVRLTRFEKAFPDRLIASIGQDEVENYLARLNVAPTTVNNERRVMHVLWEFALSKKWVRENIIARIELITQPEVRPEVLSIEQTRALLYAADPAILPSLAIAAFAGLRDSEVTSLDWSAVNWSTGYITVGGVIAKTHKLRLVPISDNLRAWLQPLVRASGPITPRNARALQLRARRTAGVKSWPHNALRHGYGTFRMAQTKDIGRVSEELGNSPQVCKKHYQKAVPDELGPEDFSIMPPAAGGNILDFQLPIS